ncbi:MAG: substrate-binding domain-containing protein, partial [Myxococcota bacterium]|nr:substrate-binding domain-containing protein [Myxococcota bacterium]
MPNELRKAPPTSIRMTILAALVVSCVPQVAPELRVFAAASTRNILESAQRTCNIPITFQFAGSQTLKLQLQHGAQADFFISANAHHIDELHHSGLVDTPR